MHDDSYFLKLAQQVESTRIAMPFGSEYIEGVGDELDAARAALVEARTHLYAAVSAYRAAIRRPAST